MRKIYYNENNQFAVNWLANLMSKGLIPKGYIDNRSLLEVDSEELNFYDECHFFAGISGWTEAIRLSGIEFKEKVWTGSCPCQPFSIAGKNKGLKDDRHLWPIWFELIRKCKPSIIFGEQVANALTHGWYDMVTDDLEKEGYETGAAVLPACSVGKPQKRDRLFFVANANSEQTQSSEPRRFQSESSSAGFNDQIEFIQCRDGKKRIVKSGICVLANGVPGRVGKLRGYGNAIVPPLAAEFIKCSYFAIQKFYNEAIQ